MYNPYYKYKKQGLYYYKDTKIRTGIGKWMADNPSLPPEVELEQIGGYLHWMRRPLEILSPVIIHIIFFIRSLPVRRIDIRLFISIDKII